VLGPLLPALVERTGLPADCKIVCGIHDSNASLLRYLGGDVGAVLSSGTWLIAASFNTPLDQLDEQADMLANTNAFGQPVACMRFMGGREFAVLAGAQPAVCSVEDIQYIVDERIFALPCFAECGGPFSGAAGKIVGAVPRTAQQSYALATLYCALMSDYCLSALMATGQVAVEGSLTGNPHFAPLLASLRQNQEVLVSDDTSGTTCGAWLLRQGGRSRPSDEGTVQALRLVGLQEYRQRWLALLA
jgi:L-fuculokinase